MTKQDRLKAILEKQDAADRAQVAELARRAIAENQAKEAKARVVHEWRRLCGILKETVATANGAMTGGRQLYLQPYNPHAVRTVGDMIVTFEDKYSEEVARKCIVGVQLNGTISVCFEPQNREYRLNIWAAMTDQIEGIVYDFMELNIEARREA